MKAMRIVGVGIAAATVAAMMMSCQPALSPFFSDKDIIEMPEITGAWVDDDENTWVVTASGDSSYQAMSNGIESEVLYDLHCFDLDGRRFVDVMPSKSEGYWHEGFLATHLVGSIVIEGDSLVLSVLDAFWVESRAKRGELDMPFARVEDGIVLTGTTSELQRFLLENIDEEGAFSRIAFYRSQAPVRSRD